MSSLEQIGADETVQALIDSQNYSGSYNLPNPEPFLKYSGNSMFIGSWHKLAEDGSWVDNLQFSMRDDGTMDVYYRYGHSDAKEDSNFDIQVDRFPFWGDEREFLMEPHQ